MRGREGGAGSSCDTIDVERSGVLNAVRLGASAVTAVRRFQGCGFDRNYRRNVITRNYT